MKERLEVNPSEQSRLRTALEYKYRRRNAHSKFLLNRYLYILRFLVVALYCDDSTVILNIASVWLVILSEVKDLKKRFFVTLRMTKLSFVIGEFISVWSHEAWMKIMPCGSLRNERANDIANIE